MRIRIGTPALSSAVHREGKEQGSRVRQMFKVRSGYMRSFKLTYRVQPVSETAARSGEDMEATRKEGELRW